MSKLEVEHIQEGDKGAGRFRSNKTIKRWLRSKRPKAENIERVTDYRTQACLGYNLAYEAGAEPFVLDYLRIECEWAEKTMKEAGRKTPREVWEEKDEGRAQQENQIRDI